MCVKEKKECVRKRKRKRRGIRASEKEELLNL